MKIPRNALITRIEGRLQEMPGRIRDAEAALAKAKEAYEDADAKFLKARNEFVSAVIEGLAHEDLRPVNCSVDCLSRRSHHYGYPPYLSIDLDKVSGRMMGKAAALEGASSRRDEAATKVTNLKRDLNVLLESRTSSTASLSGMLSLLKDSTEETISLHSKKFRTLIEDLI